MNQYSTLLYAQPSFLKGIARIFDVGGGLNTYNTSLTPEQADYRALSSDWHAVGEDIREAMNSVKKDIPTQETHG